MGAAWMRGTRMKLLKTFPAFVALGAQAYIDFGEGFVQEMNEHRIGRGIRPVTYSKPLEDFFRVYLKMSESEKGAEASQVPGNKVCTLFPDANRCPSFPIKRLLEDTGVVMRTITKAKSGGYKDTFLEFTRDKDSDFLVTSTWNYGCLPWLSAAVVEDDLHLDLILSPFGEPFGTGLPETGPNQELRPANFVPPGCSVPGMEAYRVLAPSLDSVLIHSSDPNLEEYQAIFQSLNDMQIQNGRIPIMYSPILSDENFLKDHPKYYIDQLKCEFLNHPSCMPSASGNFYNVFRPSYELLGPLSLAQEFYYFAEKLPSLNATNSKNQWAAIGFTKSKDRFVFTLAISVPDHKNSFKICKKAPIDMNAIC